MKNLNTYITEKLKLTKNIQDNRVVPKDRDDLIRILQARVAKSKQGEFLDLNDIDVSDITNFDRVFAYGTLIRRNFDVSTWDVSNGVNFSHMFFMTAFDGDLSHWDMSKAKDTSYMFKGIDEFTGKGLEKWKFKNIKNMEYMFAECQNFNSDISNWSVDTADTMEYMLYECVKFNKNLSKWKPKEDCNTSHMFDKCAKMKNILPSWYHNDEDNI